MNEKFQTQRAPSPAYRRGPARRRFILLGILALSILYLSTPRQLLLYALRRNPMSYGPQEALKASTVDDASTQYSASNKSHVGLEAHVMVPFSPSKLYLLIDFNQRQSKCPDARDCLQSLVVPAMEQISNIVDFRISFIGS